MQEIYLKCIGITGAKMRLVKTEPDVITQRNNSFDYFRFFRSLSRTSTDNHFKFYWNQVAPNHSQ